MKVMIKCDDTELERLHDFVLRLSEKVYAAHSVLANLAEKKSRPSLDAWLQSTRAEEHIVRGAHRCPK